MNRALDYAAESTDPPAQLWTAERRKRYDGIPVRQIEAVSVYDHAFDDFTVRASEVVSETSRSAGLVLSRSPALPAQNNRQQLTDPPFGRIRRGELHALRSRA